MLSYRLGKALVIVLILTFVLPLSFQSAREASAAPPTNPPVYPSNCTGAFAHTYDVGPGQPYASIGAVPFSTLQPSSIVRIHWRSTAYREKVIVSTHASAAQPVCIVGVPGPSGELPIIDGNAATTTNNMYFDYDGIQEYGVFIIMHEDYGGPLPQYIFVEGLQIQGAYRAYSFTTAAGQTRTYTDNAAGIRIVSGEHIRITGCIITDNGNGLFTQTSDPPAMITSDIILQYSYIYGNGTPNPGFDQRHNAYTETMGMVYQFNYFGPLRSGSGGNNIKDRGSGTIIRYNWIESGAHLIDLVECEDSCSATMAQPDYNQAWIYGNVLVNNSSYRNTVHWGGDNGGEDPIPGTQPCGWNAGEDPTECFHKGPLYFYNNTVIFDVSTGRKTLLRLQTNEQSAVAFNNIVHVIGSGNPISYMNTKGILNLGVNIVNRGGSTLTNFYQQASGSAVNGTANVNVLTNSAQTGFVNVATGNYALLGTSPAVNTGQALVAGALPVSYEYNATLGSRARIITSAIDQGAFELFPPPLTDTLAVFNPNASATSLISSLQDLPPIAAYNSYSPTPPAGGQWVMGDWDGDGRKTPGVYAANGVFYTTNATAASNQWTGTWFGLLNRPPVAGRFDGTINHDCLGVVDNANFPPYGTAFALYFTCNVAGGNPAKTFQWLSVLLPDNQGHTGAHQFSGGDFDGNGVDSIAVRRGPTIAWTNVAPTTQLSEFTFAQYIGTPHATDYGVLVAGDWDSNGADSFGLFYQDGAFYRRDDLLWNSGAYLLQRVGAPVGTPMTATSWRNPSGGSSGESGGQASDPNSVSSQPSRVEAENADVLKSGNWTTQAAPNASGGQYVYSRDLNGALTLRFTGTSIEIAYMEGPALGTFTVLVDDVAVRTVIATRSTAAITSTSVDYLTNESHTLQIVPIDGTVAVDVFVQNAVVPN
ncbi:MAG: hypothetical protein HY862_19865 [Chloroflexi bacterium]|nr:hypothetical protein [Chloroflexota bacterium]